MECRLLCRCYRPRSRKKIRNVVATVGEGAPPFGVAVVAAEEGRPRSVGTRELGLKKTRFSLEVGYALEAVHNKLGFSTETKQIQG